MHNAVPELKFRVVSRNRMTRTLLVSKAGTMHPAVFELLFAGAVPLPVHHLLSCFDTGFIARHRIGILLGFRTVKVECGDLDRILA